MRKYRPAVDLPTEQVATVKALAEGRGLYASTLYYHWVIDAARMAERGYGHLLPQERRARRGSLGQDVTPVRWPQARGEYQRCKALIEAAGSSVPAVLRHAGQRYIAAGGDPVSMTWPPKSVAGLAA